MALNMTLGTSQCTQEVKKMGLGDFNYKFGSEYGQNIPKLTIAHSFFAITDPNLGPVGLQVTPITSNVILNTSQNTQQVSKMVFRRF